MAPSRPSPQGSKTIQKKRQKRSICYQGNSVFHTQLYLIDICSLRDCGCMNRDWRDSNQTRPQHWNEDVDTTSHSQPRSYLQLKMHSERKISFSKGVSLVIQTTLKGSSRCQHTTNSHNFREILLCLILLCLGVF